MFNKYGLDKNVIDVLDDNIFVIKITEENDFKKECEFTHIKNDNFINDDKDYFSIRSKLNTPYITIETMGKTVYSICVNNEKLNIIEYYMSEALKWLNKNNFKSIPYNEINFVIDKNSKQVFELSKMPKALSINDSLNLENLSNIRLPNYLNIDGNINLNNFIFKNIPKQINAIGKIILTNCKKIDYSIFDINNKIHSDKIYIFPENMRCHEIVITEDEISYITKKHDFDIISINFKNKKEKILTKTEFIQEYRQDLNLIEKLSGFIILL